MVAIDLIAPWGASVRIRCASCSCATSTLASRRPVSFSDPTLITGSAGGRDSSRLPWSLACDLCAESLCSANLSLRSLSLSGLGGIGSPFRYASAAAIFHCLVSSFFLKYSTCALLSPAKLVYILDHFSSMVLNSLFLNSPAIGLPRIQVEMYVRMVGIPMESAERNRLWKCLLKEVIRQISDLLIGRRDIKREDYPVMRSSSFPPFVVFQCSEIEPEV